MQNFQVKIMLDFIIEEPLSKPRLYQFTVDTKSSGYILGGIHKLCQQDFANF